MKQQDHQVKQSQRSVKGWVVILVLAFCASLFGNLAYKYFDTWQTAPVFRDTNLIVMTITSSNTWSSVEIGYREPAPKTNVISVGTLVARTDGVWQPAMYHKKQ